MLLGPAPFPDGRMNLCVDPVSFPEFIAIRESPGRKAISSDIGVRRQDGRSKRFILKYYVL